MSGESSCSCHRRRYNPVWAQCLYHRLTRRTWLFLRVCRHHDGGRAWRAACPSQPRKTSHTATCIM